MREKLQRRGSQSRRSGGELPGGASGRRRRASKPTGGREQPAAEAANAGGERCAVEDLRGLQRGAKGITESADEDHYFDVAAYMAEEPDASMVGRVARYLAAT